LEARCRPTGHDGVDQSDVFFGKSTVGHRESLLSFVGPELVAVRWKQFRIYFTDMHPTGEGPQRIGGLTSADAPMAGYPRAYNIESDPHEDLNVASFNGWLAGSFLPVIIQYENSVKEHPNPPAPNLTRFRAGG
jgi:arylsulfatase